MKLGRIAAVLIAGLLSVGAHAQPWPQRPVKVIVPFPAGGAVDIPARVLGEKLRQIWGQPFVIENRPGAGGSIGASEAARAAPDGYTLFFPAGSVMTAHQFIYPKLSYDPEKDFAPVTMVVSGPQALVVSVSSPFKTVDDLVTAAKAYPGKFTFGHAGIGAQSHLAAENFIHAAGINAVSVPYKGGDPAALNDLIAGLTTFCVTNLSTTIGYVNAGRLRALGVTSRSRAAQLQSTPSIAESVPNFENNGWFGIVVPVGTPQEIIQKLYRDTKNALEDTHVKARYFALGLTPVGNSPDEMAKAMKEERQRWAKVIRERKIQAE